MPDNTPTMTGGEAVVEMLAKHGVTHIFGVCGDTSLPMYDALRNATNRITHILARDERCAAYMADVYARLTGRVGIVEGPSGAGATYMVPGIAEAQGTTIPVLAITSDIPVSGRGKFVLTECDQESLFRPFTKSTEVVPLPNSIPGAFRRAFTAMTTGTPGTAHIGLPYDVLKGQVDVAETWADESLGQYPSRPTQPASAELDQAIILIQQAQRPLIICGGGVLHSRAEQQLTRLAELIGAPVGTTISAKGTLAETHPLALGTIGTNGSTKGSRDVVRESDLIIYAGCRVGSVTSEKGTNPVNGEKRIIHIDIDPICIGANYSTDVALVGDAKLTINEMLSRLQQITEITKEHSWALEAVEQAKRQKHERFMQWANSNENPIYPERLTSALQKTLPQDALVISDPGTPTPYLCAFYEAQQSGRSFIFHRHHGGLGFALPGVVGAHFGLEAMSQSRKVVGIMGDGSFGFSSGELETIVRHRIPTMLVVVNNASFGWIKAGQDRSYGSRFYGVDFLPTDHAAIAAAYGIRSWRIERADDLEKVLEEALAHDGPTLVDIITRPLDQTEVPVTAFLG